MGQAKDYTEEDIIQFLKEEFERIIAQYPSQKEGGVLPDARAFETWFLHQETGIDYDKATECILDDRHDCGVDFIWIDESNRKILIGQAEYETNWSRSPASETKAAKTFSKFQDFLKLNRLPDDLHELGKKMWRLAKQKIGDKDDGYGLRLMYITPKHFSALQEERIRADSDIPNYEFLTHDVLIERGEDFLNGQTGICSFELNFDRYTLFEQDFGKVYVGSITAKDIWKLVESHIERKRLRALFASNVRGFLSSKKRSREIAEDMKTTLSEAPEEFFIRNNGITIQCSKATQKDHLLVMERASICNGCQTAMNIHSYFRENEGAEPLAKVLVTVAQLEKDANRLAGEIAKARNNQNPVDARDLMSNNFILVCLHHRLMADRVAGSERRYYLLRKAGEKQTLLREEPESKGRYVWIDVAELAQCIASIIRQDPYMAQQGISNLFGRDFKKVFPGISDPTHSRCKYSWWLAKMMFESYDNKSKWRGTRDEQVYLEKDFKNPAAWITVALLAKKLKDDLSFKDNMEERFVHNSEKWYYGKKSEQSKEFSSEAFEMMDDAYSLVHAISRRMLGKKLPKGEETYSNYDALLKAPYTYEAILSELRKGKAKTYHNQLRKSMRKLHEYLQNN